MRHISLLWNPLTVRDYYLLELIIFIFCRPLYFKTNQLKLLMNVSQQMTLVLSTIKRHQHISFWKTTIERIVSHLLMYYLVTTRMKLASCCRNGTIKLLFSTAYCLREILLFIIFYIYMWKVTDFVITEEKKLFPLSIRIYTSTRIYSEQARSWGEGWGSRG